MFDVFPGCCDNAASLLKMERVNVSVFTWRYRIIMVL